MNLLFAIVLLASNAGNAWEKLSVQTTASLRGLSPVNASVVWACGANGTVIRTIDGGKTWIVMTVPGAEKLDFRGIYAFDEKTALIMSSGRAEEGQARIYRTKDAGKTWKLVYEQKTPGIFFDAVAFWDRKHGIVLSDPVEVHFVLFTTSDGGSTWKQLQTTALPPALPKGRRFCRQQLMSYGAR